MSSALQLIAASGRFRASSPPADPSVATTIAITGTPSVAEGGTTQLTATVYDQYGAVMVGQTVTWTSDSAHATVSASGLVSGVTAGTAGITAHVGALSSAPYTVTVTAAALLSPTLTAQSGDQQVTLTFAATGGTPPYTFDLYQSDTAGTLGAAVATGITSPYTLAGLTNGVTKYFTIRVTDAVPATADSVQRSVTPGVQVATVEVTPSTLSLHPGETGQFTAVAKDADGNVMEGQTFIWYAQTALSNATATKVSKAPTLFTVDNTGLVTALDRYCDAVYVTAKVGTITSAKSFVAVTEDPAGPPLAFFVNFKSAGRILDLDASYSHDPAGGAITYDIDWGDGSAHATTVTAQHTYAADGDYTVTLTVTKGDLQTGTFSKTVHIAAVAAPRFSTDFTPGSYDAQNGYQFTSNNFTNALTTEWVQPGKSQSLRFGYIQQIRDGVPYVGGGSGNEQRFKLGEDLNEYWTRILVYHPDGTEGIAGVARYEHGYNGQANNNFKFFTMFREVTGSANEGYSDFYAMKSVWQAWTTATLAPDERADFGSHLTTAINGLVLYPAGHPYFSPSLDDDGVGTMRRGQWDEIILHHRVAQWGQSNGVATMYVNGVPYSVPSLPIGESRYENSFWNHAYFFGAANWGTAEDTAVYLQEVEFYDMDPLA